MVHVRQSFFWEPERDVSGQELRYLPDRLIKSPGSKKMKSHKRRHKEIARKRDELMTQRKKSRWLRRCKKKKLALGICTAEPPYRNGSSARANRRHQEKYGRGFGGSRDDRYSSAA